MAMTVHDAIVAQHSLEITGLYSATNVIAAVTMRIEFVK
jgi:hypothetical protein